ncbi:MAG: chromosome partitioning protein ParA, partial [Lachnospiraceae bacterium]|nr:chromosome partitioning protein ParA [Lachnospiraceae bacterium]
MKIKLAILEKDTSYLNRLVSAFGTKYADKFEIYSFTDKAVAMDNIDKAKIDVFVAGSEFEIDTEILPRRCGFAYFVESIEIDTYKNQMAICKYQKADLIYKQILSIYSENAGNISGLKLGEDVSRVIFYTSVSGGTGSSSMAVATAMHYA